MSLRKIYYACGGINMLFIGSTNAYNSIKIVADTDDRGSNGPASRVIGVVLFSSIFGGITFIKSAYFAALGPIGTYRISLAYLNYTRTNDKKWIKVLTKPGSSIGSYYESYIIKPFGTASWIPLTK